MLKYFPLDIAANISVELDTANYFMIEYWCPYFEKHHVYKSNRRIMATTDKQIKRETNPIKPKRGKRAVSDVVRKNFANL